MNNIEFLQLQARVKANPDRREFMIKRHLRNLVMREMEKQVLISRVVAHVKRIIDRRKRGHTDDSVLARFQDEVLL